MHRLRHLAPALILGAALAAACSGPIHFRPVCASDAECWQDHDGNKNWKCLASTYGTCVCENDQACHENEHCEPVPAGDGQCHPNRLCELNRDCDNGAICGPDQICRQGCISDLQCQVGNICDLLQKKCVPGCYTFNDCADRAACLCKDPAGHDTFCTCDPKDHAGCQPGVCSTGVCQSKDFCPWGDLCQLDDKGVQRCVVDKRGPYCQKCNNLSDTECQSEGSANFCLLNDASRGNFFCGVDCDEGQECPGGYICDDVLVLTRNACQSDGQCSPSPGAPNCASDADCGDGNRCTAGHCAGKCYSGEGATQGFCSCVADSDCPADSCSSDGRCTITRKPCVGGANDTCANQIRCINSGGVGYCKIGRNCGPGGGLTCAEIQNQ